LSVDIRSAHVVTTSDASVVVALGIGRGSVALALRLLMTTLQSLALLLLVKGAAPRLSSPLSASVDP
jgi:hypothetical protein